MHAVVLRTLLGELERDLGAKETRRLRQLVTLSNESADVAFRELLSAHLSLELVPSERHAEALALEFVRAEDALHASAELARVATPGADVVRRTFLLRAVGPWIGNEMLSCVERSDEAASLAAAAMRFACLEFAAVLRRARRTSSSSLLTALADASRLRDAVPRLEDRAAAEKMVNLLYPVATA